MPQICLTAEQQRQKWLAQQYAKLSDGLAAFKNRERLSNSQVASGLGSNTKIIAKLLRREPARVDVETFFLALNAAGYMVVKIQKEKGAEE